MSKLFSLDTLDAVKATIVAIISAILTALLEILQTTGVPTGEQVRHIIIVGATSGVAYLVKNYFTNSQGNLTKEPLSPNS